MLDTWISSQALSSRVLHPDTVIANQSGAFAIPDTEVEAACAAIQRQLYGDWAPHWASPGVIHYAGPRPLMGASGKVSAEWGITLSDKNARDYLGEHHLDGVPRGVVLLGACKEFGEDWRSVLSHEILELRGDFMANICVELPDGTIEAYESCDAPQGTDYEIDGVPVANFVVPLGYFSECGNLYDFRKKLTAPHTRTPGGYRLVKKPGEQWSQDEGMHVMASKRREAISPWSRRGRRIARTVIVPPFQPRAA